MHPSNAPVRLVHFSDIHVTARPLGWRRADWFNKRLAAWLNLRGLGRGFRFRHADRVLAALMADLHRSPPDRVVFSGDATALGFEAEVAHAARILELVKDDHLPGLAVPGNHDYHTGSAARSGAFERLFAPWQQGERVGDAVYPFAQRVGGAWLIAVNTSVPNRWFWDARGDIDAGQLDRLSRLFERLDSGTRILVTHYPICLAGGSPEKRHHGLRNLDRLVEAAEHGGVQLWLHGHRHRPYHHAATILTSFPVICAGSATQSGLWTYGDYTLDGTKFTVVRKAFDEAADRFREVESFALQLNR
jgi:3',5'-cyclic AMP phosphodiesterase CpdA